MLRLIRSMATAASPASRRNLIAVCQMTNDNDLEANWNTAKDMIERASERSCKVKSFSHCQNQFSIRDRFKFANWQSQLSL